VKLFADDVKLYLQITNDADDELLQCAIDAFTDWADEWQLSVSVNKCSTLKLGELSVIQTLLLTDPSCQLLSQRVIQV